MLEIPKQTAEAIAVMAATVEIKPDMFSNALGISLFIPLVATILTIVIVATGFNMPEILKANNSLFGIYMGWIIFGGLAVLALIIIGGGALLGSLGAKGEAKPKVKKEKSPKSPKEKKEKKK